MSNELKDILSSSNKDIDNQQLMDYLSNHLSKSKSHEVEATMAEDEFINDAIEGLQEMKSTKDVQAYVEQLNTDLQKQVAKNKKYKLKRKLKDQPFTYIAIIIILILLIISFVVLKKYMDNRKTSNPSSTSQVTKLNY